MPTPRKIWVPGEDAACSQRIMMRHDHGEQADGDAQIGQAEQQHGIDEGRDVSDLGWRWRAIPATRTAPSARARAPETAMLGQENQRCAMSGSTNGVHRLTMPTAARVPRKRSRVFARALLLQAPFGFQDQPACAQQAITEHKGDCRSTARKA